MSSQKPLEAQSSKRERILRRFVLSIALIGGSGAAFGQGTPEQQEACTPDVFRLCSNYIPDVDNITVCLKQRKLQLSNPCRDVLFNIPAATRRSDRKKSK